jgi:hypothetical protein
MRGLFALLILGFTTSCVENNTQEPINRQIEETKPAIETIEAPKESKLIFIQVSGSSKADIRTAPTDDATIITQAREGDIFETVKEKGEWIEIKMFSGEYRYIDKSKCIPIDYELQLPESEAERKRIFKAILAAEDRAELEAEKKFSSDINKNIEYARILNDKYKLEVFQEFNLPSPIYLKLIVEGSKKNWHK